MKDQMQNGSRLGEHRKRRVSPESWWLLGIVVVALLSLVQYSEAQEYEPFNVGTGLVVQYAEICFTPELSTEAIKLLDTWQRLVNELEAYERGGSAMNSEDALLGQLLYNSNICHTVADFYHIVILRRTEGYTLVKFDEQYSFDAGPFIVRAQDVVPDRGI
jgi:hypothetical protein